MSLDRQGWVSHIRLRLGFLDDRVYRYRVCRAYRRLGSSRVNIFTYGSLMFPEVWEAVTGNLHASQPGSIAGYVRRCVRDVTFPGIIATGFHTDQIDGVIYLGVEQRSLELLDDFESDFYDRLPVETDIGSCQAYVVPESNAGYLTEDLWDPEEFERLHLESYISRNFG